jgi:hypothetical protein
MSKYYHGYLIERTRALVFALTGNHGKKGSDFVGFPRLDQDGLEAFVRDMFSLKDTMHPTALESIGKTIAALQSDYALPAAGWHQHSEHKWATPLMPFVHVGEKATSSYDARSDWEIFSRLAETLARRAEERGLPSCVDRRGDQRPLHNLYEKFSHGGKYGHTDRDTRLEVERAATLERRGGLM